MTDNKDIMVVQADLIARGFIKEVRPDEWRTTEAGMVEAMKIFNSLGRFKTALVMIVAAQTIEFSEYE